MLFTSAMSLLDQMVAAVISHTLGKMPEALGNLFFQLVSGRYEKGSIILSTNKPLDRWGRDVWR